MPPPSRFSDVVYPWLERRLGRTAGGEVVYIDGGRPGGRPPVVLVPPLGRGLMHFGGNLERLAAGGRVLAYDPPGTGKSVKGVAALDTVAAQLVTLEELMRATGAAPAVLAGVSFGGALALRFAAERPDLVRGVVACGVPAGRRIAARLAAGMLLRGPLLAALPASAWRRGIARFFPEPHPHVEESAAFIARLRGSPDWRAYTASLARLGRSAARDLALERALPRVRAPALLLWGEKDAVAPVARARAQAAALPGARLVVLEGCGHFPNIQRPRDFDALVEEFARGVPAP